MPHSSRFLTLPFALVAFSTFAASNPIAYYAFDEASGTTALDQAATPKNGTLTGGVTRVPGVLNGALSFDGSTGYVSVPNSPDLSGGSFTVAGWIYRKGGVEKKFVSKWNDNTSSYQFDFQVYQDSKLWFQVQKSSNVGVVARGTTLIDVNKWYHVAAVAETSTSQLRVYVNGVLETLQAAPGWDGTIRPQNMEMNIGRKVSGYDYWNGAIDDVRIYNAALTQADITALASAPPKAIADAYSTPVGAQLSVTAPGILSNDIDPGITGSTAILDNNVSHGNLTLNANGSFTYTPTAGYIGIDSFTYHIKRTTNEVSPPASVAISLVTRYSLTIPIAGTYNVPNGQLYSPPLAIATFSDSSATINYLELTYTDTVGASGRNYDAIGFLHTVGTLDNANFLGRIGADQIGRLTSGYPTTMTFYERYDFETQTGAFSTPGNGTVEFHDRAPLAFDATKTLYARLWVNRGDGGTGPTCTNIKILADVTCSLMPGAVITGSSQKTINWVPSAANLAVTQKLYRATSAAGPFTILQSFSDNTTASFNDTTVSAGTTYYYKVVAETSGGIQSADSNVYVLTPALVDGLIGWYKLDDGSGLVAVEASNNANNGTLVSGPTWTSGIKSGALGFDGVDDKLTLPDNLIHAYTTQTIALWFKTTSNGTLVGQQNTGGNNYVSNLYIGTDGKLRGELWMGSVTPMVSIGSAANGAWHHAAITGNVNTQSLYLDGQLVSTLNGTIQHLDMSKNQLANGITGAWTSTPYFNGALDDVRFYNRALNAAEIQALAYLPPVANADAFGAATGQLTSFAAPGVLANDQSSYGTTVSAILETDVSHGTLSLNANGSFAYTPATGFTGTDSFTYHAADNQSGISSPVAVTVSVVDLGISSISPNTGASGQQLSNVVVSGNGFRISTPPNPPGAMPFNGHNYLYISTPMTWFAARDYCYGLNGHLVTLGSAGEDTFVRGLTQADRWIGLTDEAMEGTFVWITGEPLVYTNWTPGEPNNATGVEDHVEMGASLGWNDFLGTNTLGFVCEFEPAPTSVKLKKGSTEIRATNVRINTSSQMLADLNLVGAGLSTWDVIVTDLASGATVILPNGFTTNLTATTTVSNAPSPISYKSTAQNIVLNATVTPASGTLNEGNVSFQLKSGNTNVGNAVNSGTVTNNLTGNVTYSVPAGTPAGSYTISATYNGTSAYAPSSDSSKSLTINKAPLAVTAANTSRLYGAANPTFSGTLTGVQSGDGITASYSSAATAATPVGTASIVPALNDPNNKLGNYNVTSTNGTLTINKATITVAAANNARNYGAANPIFSGTLTGVVNNDNILAVYNSTAAPATAVGNYAITPSLLDPDSKLGNYTVNSSNGTLIINKAPLSVTPDSKSRAYGSANPSLTGVISGIQNSDDITASYSTSATPASAVGNYSITATLADPGSKLGNYMLTQNTGTLTVGQAALVVTPADKSKTYGDPNPALTGTLTGVANKDIITATFVTGATASSPAGLYPINAVLTDPGSKLTNYAVTNNVGALTINPAPLTVSVENKTKTFGEPNPVFTGSLSGAVNGDDISATFTSAATASSPAGTYAITAVLADPGAKLASYALNATNGTLTILKSTPVIKWAQPARIVAGVPLDSAQLNASAQDPLSAAALAGTFAYTPAPGSVLSPGLAQPLAVTFTPTDSADYNNASGQTTLDVDPAIPPAITSALTATAKRNEDFSYTLTADGSLPMTFSAENLPAGLAFSGNSISGAPTATGIFFVTLSASNFGGKDTKSLKLTITQDGNHAPVIASPPSAAPNPAQVGEPITFSAQVTDSDGDALDYGWDFGDATFGHGPSVTKTFTAKGVYVVKLTVSDGQSTVSQTVNVAVQEQPDASAFKIDKFKLSFNFVKKASDTLSLSGQVPLAQNFAPSGKSVRVLIGLLDKEFPLDAKGKSPDKSFALKSKPGATSATFTFALKKADLFEKLAGLGFEKHGTAVKIDVPVLLSLDGRSHLAAVSVLYSVKSTKDVPQSGGTK